MYLHVKLSTVLKQFCEIINKGNRVMYVSDKLIELPINWIRNKSAVYNRFANDVWYYLDNDKYERPNVSSKLPIREGEANTIAHLDGRCVKVHDTTVRNVLNRNTLILIANPYEFTLTRTLYQSDRSLEHKWGTVTGVMYLSLLLHVCKVIVPNNVLSYTRI